MTTNKDFKRLVRARMRKTGEAYTAARAQLVKKPARTPAAAAAVASAPRLFQPSVKPNDYATLAGMSDAAVKEKTGCTWERWVRALDRLGAQEMSHRDIAALVKSKYKVQDWWTQTVTVGYERIKGLRARGQQRNGTYDTTKSRTFNVPVTTLYDAWADPGIRRRWLDGATVKVRTAIAPKSMRLDWNNAGVIAVEFTAKGTSKSAVAVAHTKLPDRDAVTRLKAYWSERLAALDEVLAQPQSISR